MKRRRQDFALGLTAIVFVAAFLATVLFLYPSMQTGGRPVEIRFPHEEGLAPLKVGSSVLLSGSIEVGRVTDLQIEQLLVPTPLSPQKRTFFVVKADIRKDVPLYGNCKITTDQPAIGGNGFVSILNVGTPDVPLTGPVIGLPPQSLSAAISTLSRRLLAPGGFVDNLNEAVDPDAEKSIVHKMLLSLDDMNAITRQLRSEMNPHEQATLLHTIHRVLDDLNAATASLRAEMSTGNDAALLAKLHLALTHLDEGLSDAAAMLKENRPLVHDTLASVEHTARTIDQELLVRLKAELDPANSAGTLGRLHLAMDRVNESLENVREMTAAGERAVVLGRPAIDKTLENFVNMSDQLRQASQEVLLNPSKLIWGPSREREDKLLIFRAASEFAQAASQLDDASARLKAVLQTLPAGGPATEADTKELQSVYDAVQAAFQRFGRAEEVLWDQLK
jgi:ABC-type transporter Mla subunit MlaD